MFHSKDAPAAHLSVVEDTNCRKQTSHSVQYIIHLQRVHVGINKTERAKDPQPRKSKHLAILLLVDLFQKVKGELEPVLTGIIKE